ncbi:MAG: metallophosphoesterase [Coraliomargaritaceae bacterium]
MLQVESASNRKRSGILWYILVPFALMILYAVFRNFFYIRRGMLKPDFGLIHQCYDFNLMELPLTLLAVSGICALASPFIGRRFWISSAVFVLLALDLFALRYYMTQIEPNRHAVRHVRIASPKLTEPIRLLHLSDIQSGGIGAKEVALFQQIRDLKPDIILNTGDYLQAIPPKTAESELPKLVALMEQTSPELGTWGVYGDTDYLLYRFQVSDFAPLELLSSSSVSIITKGGDLSLHGLNLNQSRDFNYARRSIKLWLEAADSSAFKILLGHSPNFALGVGELPIDLCLAGHTHGGQVWLPFFGPLVTDSKVPRDWARGFRRVGIPYLNVSAGAGSNRFEGLPPMRLNCPTEMTLIELVPMASVR